MNTLVHEAAVFAGQSISGATDLRDFINGTLLNSKNVDPEIVDSSNRRIGRAQLVSETLSDGSVAYSIRLLP